MKEKPYGKFNMTRFTLDITKAENYGKKEKKKPFVHNQKHFLAPHMASKVTEHAMRYLSLIKMIIYNTINNTINPNTHPVTVQEMKC